MTASVWDESRRSCKIDGWTDVSGVLQATGLDRGACLEECVRLSSCLQTGNEEGRSWANWNPKAWDETPVACTEAQSYDFEGGSKDVLQKLEEYKNFAEWKNTAVLNFEHESYKSKERLTGNGEITAPADAYVN